MPISLNRPDRRATRWTGRVWQRTICVVRCRRFGMRSTKYVNSPGGWKNSTNQWPTVHANLRDASVDGLLRRHNQVLHEFWLSDTGSINEYDRLVTWASGGALGLSITLIEKFGSNADRATARWLALGLTALGFAFAASLWSQYFSSRIHSWRRRELDHLQKPEAERARSRTSEAVRLHRIVDIHGAATKWLTRM
jgi:hypothetical protein